MRIAPIVNILNTMEKSDSLSMFALDTGGCLGSKLAVSRTGNERREISFAEVAESLIFYFSGPLIAGRLGKFISKNLKNKDLFNKSLIEAEKTLEKNSDELKKIKLGKFSQIGTTFALVLPTVFAIAPMRNLLTLSETGKKEFTSVVGLKKESENKNRKEAKDKAVKFAKNIGLVTLASLGAVGAMALSCKNKNFYKKVEPYLTGFIKKFEFNDKFDFDNIHYAAFIYPVSIASYFYACRDKYETRENAVRFSITVPIMFLFDKLIEKPIHKMSNFLFNSNVFNKNNIMKFEDILNNSSITEKAQTKLLNAKAFGYATTFTVKTLVLGAAVALLNRYWSKKQYEREHRLDAQASNNPFKDILIKYSQKTDI